MSTPMVLAILQDKKFQTRRQIKLPNWATSWDDFETDGKTAQIICEKTGCLSNIICPYYADILWVRETWRHALSDTHQCYAYKCGKTYQCGKPIPEDEYSSASWKPSIHMPRAASRISLKILNIRVEQLQDITEQDAIAEGIINMGQFRSDGYAWHNYLDGRDSPDKRDVLDTARESFASLWRSISGWESWGQNPYVWVVEFERC